MYLMTIPEAAQYMRVSRSYIYRLTASGRIRFFKVGSACRFSVEQLDEYLGSLEVLPVKSGATT